MLLEGYNFFLNLDLEIMSENYWLLLREVFIGSCPSICLQMSENLSVGGFLPFPVCWRGWVCLESVHPG